MHYQALRLKMEKYNLSVCTIYTTSKTLCKQKVTIIDIIPENIGGAYCTYRIVCTRHYC